MGPLHGIRIVEIEGIGSCPFAGMLLSDLGAEVIRVGRPEPSFLQASFDVMSRGKKSITLDLKKPEEKTALLKVVATADALIEGFRPGVTERLGLGPGGRRQSGMSGTSPQKIAAIEFHGGRCHLVHDPTTIYAESQRLADELKGHYMDQFTFAEKATDWRANNNMAESIYLQMQREPHPCPAWIVASAGTGGTLATIGRYVHYCRHDTRVCGVDAEHSVFFDYYVSGSTRLSLQRGSRIEGIGRPRVEASFVPGVLDAMVKVPDVWSLAAMHALSVRLGRRVGGSTGTNLIAALACAQSLKAKGLGGSIVTLLCDDGQRYRHSYFDDDWLRDNDLECGAQSDAIDALFGSGEWPADLRRAWRLAGCLNL